MERACRAKKHGHRTKTHKTPHTESHKNHPTRWRRRRAPCMGGVQEASGTKRSAEDCIPNGCPHKMGAPLGGGGGSPPSGFVRERSERGAFASEASAGEHSRAKRARGVRERSERGGLYHVAYYLGYVRNVVGYVSMSFRCHLGSILVMF